MTVHPLRRDVPGVRMTRTLAIALALCLAQPAIAQQPRESSPEQQARRAAAREATAAYHRRLSATLAANGGARELAFAATLRDLAALAALAADAPDDRRPDDGTPSQAVPRDVDVDAWRRTASAKAGSDAVANFLLLSGSGDEDATLRRAVAARLASAEPDNLAPLALAGDATALLGSSRSRFDLHAYDQVRWIMAAFARTPPTAAEADALYGDSGMGLDEYAAVSAMGLWSAVSLPNLEPLVDACSGAALTATPTRRADCQRIGRSLADASDTSVGESIGLVLLERAAGDAERAAVDARRRAFDWRMQQWFRVSQQQPRDGAGEFARLLRDPALRGEPELIARLLTAAGVPLDPPADWQPPRRPQR